MSDNYEDMTVAELKALLKEQGLPVSGKKADLIERLSQSAQEEDSEVVEDVVEESTDEDFDEEDDNWDDDDDWDDEEDEGHVAKQKPVLSDDMKAALALRNEQKKKTPSFRRTEWFRYKRLSRSGWRAPHGMDSKQRRNYKYRSSLVRVGHGKVAAARGLHPSGFREVMVQNPNDLDNIDPETEAARVGRSVGGRKREQIYSRADELGIRVLNRRRDV
jgi:large subunit ribosomal protein L32e|tara:strand:+ start:664 stop:1317 length:654 start_codon:yes stop_codon:yes gene_type:complete